MIDIEVFLFWFLTDKIICGKNIVFFISLIY